jgi:HAMP domain-containing protein
MYVVFIYGIITPNISDLVQYRILDTVVSSLAFVANHFFMAFLGISKCANTSRKTIKANQIYLQEIATFIIKGSISTSYRLARKNAFIEIGNLMASFQRMTQEPKSKQNNYHKCTNWLF